MNDGTFRSVVADNGAFWTYGSWSCAKKYFVSKIGSWGRVVLSLQHVVCKSLCIIMVDEYLRCRHNADG